MADDTTIIEGTVKFRDGKKWKSRWCVMRKLSPVADCVQLQLFRDARARGSGAASKASLSLQHYVGCESGFTLDKHSHTLALVCRDHVAVLAFETRERLIQWQVKVNAHLGEPRNYLVLVAATGARRLAAGPARLHVAAGGRAALTAGAPPRLLGLWELQHLRRYGVVEGRFCFEGGSLCGAGEGLHVLLTDRARDIARDFSLAALGRLEHRPRTRTFGNDGGESPKSHKTYRADTRLSELNTVESSLAAADRLYSRPADDDAASPCWPSAERPAADELGLGDAASVHEAEGAAWAAAGVSLERCVSCMSKLGALSRSSTAAATPGAAPFSPAWTMDALRETPAVSGAALAPDAGPTPSDVVPMPPDAAPTPPARPPKPATLQLAVNKSPMPLPACSCRRPQTLSESVSTKVGPYENYDVPKVPSSEVEGEYYDTPKRLKECLDDELFRITKSSTSNTVILKKPCGCLLRFGKRPKAPTVIDTDENFQQTNCACQRVTDWAQNWIKLPYCRKNTASTENLAPNKENLIPNFRDRNALYATIDVSRKTRRRMRPSISHDEIAMDSRPPSLDPHKVEVDEGPLANYENLSFALSLEHYENAKDLLRKAGVTQSELNAITANLKPESYGAPNGKRVCTKCGHRPSRIAGHTAETNEASSNDDYLMMEPNTIESNKLEQSKSLPAGYTPMSPIGGFAFRDAPRPRSPAGGGDRDEKSASNPALCGASTDARPAGRAARGERRERSSSADSSRFLDDVKEFESGRGSSSSVETLRDVAPPEHKHSDADSSEASKLGRGDAPATAAAGGGAPGNRDSSSSNDSGVSSWSLRRAGLPEFELPRTTAAARRHYRSARRAAAARPPPLAARRSRSTDPLCESAATRKDRESAKSSSAEAEVPVLTAKPLRSVMDTHSTSSGTSDMSDYIETLSICSSHSSTDTPITMRVRPSTSTLRPRSGKEYQPLAPRRAPPGVPRHLCSDH